MTDIPWFLHIVQGNKRSEVDDTAIKLASSQFTFVASIPDGSKLRLNVCGHQYAYQQAGDGRAPDVLGPGRSMAEGPYGNFVDGSPKPWSITLSDVGHHSWPVNPMDRWHRTEPPTTSNANWTLERDVGGLSFRLDCWSARPMNQEIFLVAAVDTGKGRESNLTPTRRAVILLS